MIGEDVFGNAVELTTFTDANGNFVFDGLNAGTFSVFQTQPEGFDDGIERSNVASTVADNQLNDIVLGFNQNFTDNSFGEIQIVDDITGTVEGTSGSPTRLPPIIGVGPALNNAFGNFLGGPGPVYSGIPINSNSNPLTLQSNRPVTGGYSSGFAVAPAEVAGVDCGCPEVIEAPYAAEVPYDAQGAQPYAGDAGVYEEVVNPEFINEAATDCGCQTCEEFVECNDCSDCGNCCDCGGSAGQGGFLFRMKNWLHR